MIRSCKRSRTTCTPAFARPSSSACVPEPTSPVIIPDDGLDSIVGGQEVVELMGATGGSAVRGASLMAAWDATAARAMVARMEAGFMPEPSFGGSHPENLVWSRCPERSRPFRMKCRSGPREEVVAKAIIQLSGVFANPIPRKGALRLARTASDPQSEANGNGLIFGKTGALSVWEQNRRNLCSVYTSPKRHSDQSKPFS